MRSRGDRSTPSYAASAGPLPARSAQQSRAARDRPADRQPDLRVQLPADPGRDRGAVPAVAPGLNRTRARRAALERAKARLDPLDLYPDPVRIEHVAVLIWPWLFRLPWFRRFDGYAAWWTVLLRGEGFLVDHDLITHELCHVWQMQHRPLRMPLSYLRTGYAGNPYELEASRAVELTR